MALAPVPITPTRLPRESTPCSHCAEWNSLPAKSSSPAIAGKAGRLSPPRAADQDARAAIAGRPPTSTRHQRCRSVPCRPRDVHAEAQVPPRTPKRSAQASQVGAQLLAAA